MQELGFLFGQILKVPEDILESERTQLSLYVMIDSAKITKERRLSPEVLAKLGPHALSIRDNYFNIYFENSVRKRFVFFAEPLIKYLWGLFRDQRQQVFREYFSEILTQQQGKEKVLKLVKDANLLQEAIEYQILP